MIFRKLLVTLIVILLLTGCEIATLNTTPLTSDTGTLWIEGIYHDHNGSKLSDPQPQAGKFLQVEQAGFVVSNQQVAYYVKTRVIEEPSHTCHIKAEYQNPLNENKPITSDMTFEPYFNALTFKSPAGITGIRYNQLYTIKLSIYPTQDSDIPIDSITQKVRAYVDTTRDEIRVVSH